MVICMNTRLFISFGLLIVAGLLVLTGCPNPAGGDPDQTNAPEEDVDDDTADDTTDGSDDSTDDGSEEEDVDDDPGEVDLGGDTGASVDAPVDVEASVVSDTSGYPSDAKTPLLELSGDLGSGETATISFTVSDGLTDRDVIVRATGSGTWERVGTTELSSDGTTVSITVSDLNGVWAVVTVPAAPTVTSGADGSTRRPSWSWEVDSSTGAVRYQLNGTSDSWVEVSDPSTTSFTPTQDLPLGEHTLYVQAGTGTGLWSDTQSLTVPVHYDAADFFNLDAGFGVKYKVTDTYVYSDDSQTNSGSPFNVWVVNQTPISTGDEFFSGIITVMPETEISKGPYSALIFSTSLDGSSGVWGFGGGMPASGQAQMLRYMTAVDATIIDGVVLTDPENGVVYAWSYGGERTVGGNPVDTVRIDVSIDQSSAEQLAGSNPAEYYEGEGYVILAPDVGPVELQFDRTNGTSLSFDRLEHGIQSRHTLSGTLDDSTYDVANSTYYVHLDTVVGEFNPGTGVVSDPLPGATADANGEFSLDVYGPVARLYVGLDRNSDGLMDVPLPGVEFVPDTSAGDIGVVQ